MMGRWRRLVGMGGFSVVLFSLFVALGIWQIHRYHYKLRVADTIRHARLAKPVPMPPNPTPFQKVSIVGRWMADRVAFYGDQIRNTPAGPVRGAQLIVPFRPTNGHIVMVDLGWVKGTVPYAVPVPVGETEVSGYVQRFNGVPFFHAADNPHAHVFYTLDPIKIGKALGLGGVADFTLVMIGPKPLAGGPIPARSLPQPPNNSQQYYLTWFGLAIVVIFEFIFYARKQLGDNE